MKKILFISLSLILLVSVGFLAKSIFAEDNQQTDSSNLVSSIKPIIKDVASNDLRQSLSIQENKAAIYKCGEKGDKCPTVNNQGGITVTIMAGKLTEINTDNIKVLIFGQTFTVKLPTDARIVRQYWGVSSVSEFSIGDIINVYGSMTATDYGTIIAKTVRDVSIQKKQGVFKGTVESVGTNSFVFKSNDRGNQTVIVSSSTIITKPAVGLTCIKAAGIDCPKQINGTIADITVGLVVSVRGVWNKTLSQIQADSIVIGKIPELLNNKGEEKKPATTTTSTPTTATSSNSSTGGSSSY